MKAIATILFLTVGLYADPSEQPAFREVAYVSGTRERPPRAVVSEPGRERSIDHAIPSAWVRAWAGFAVFGFDECIEGQGLGRLDGSGAWEVVDRTGAYAITPGSWAVSPDGKRLATYFEAEGGSNPTLEVRSVPGARLVQSFDRKKLERELGSKWRAEPSLRGVAWSPASRYVAFAHGVGGGIDNGGVSETRTAVLDTQTGRVRHYSVGAPVAWLDEHRLIMITDRTGGDYRDVWVGQTRGVRYIHGVLSADFDGEAIVAYRKLRDQRLRRERWTTSMQRRLDAYEYPPGTPLLGADPRYVAPAPRRR